NKLAVMSQPLEIGDHLLANLINGVRRTRGIGSGDAEQVDVVLEIRQRRTGNVLLNQDGRRSAKFLGCSDKLLQSQRLAEPVGGGGADCAQLIDVINGEPQIA